ncbi:NnrU family protein [Mangrovicoccus algicola]|uniref:NnrU family protein n=1 Tax=Mangrovicoccus algicola TaxID=2771008 RepID=A0A8J7CYL6_9RHOB|nr:NnrU family protein [Mangrovicoccus algicola]MBE3636688.1 NnrU family protein [Mangrovicoccus algicola]
MAWLALIAGIALWVGAHLLGRLAPARREAMGRSGRGIVAALVGLSVVLMVLGFRATPYVAVWTPPALMTHLNNVLMLGAVFLFMLGQTKGGLARRIRHPMLSAVKLWAVAHLMVNGDLASILLFGSMLGWAVASVIVINRAEPHWERPAEDRRGDLKAVLYGIVFYAAAVAVHVWTGHYPMG